VLAEVVALHDPVDATTAAMHYTDSLALAEELGMRPLAAHCHLGLGTLYRHRGARHQAGEHLAVALAMYHEMGIRSWPEQAEAEMRRLG
jgi:hypothetical protein